MSAGLSQKDRIASCKIKGDSFVVTQFHMVEGLSELFALQIECLSEEADIDLSTLLAEKGSVRYSLRGSQDRFFNGVVAEASWLGTEGRYYRYSFTLRPWLWLLSHRADCKIFKDKTAPEIIREIFNKESKGNFVDKTSEQYQKMEYCVQYRETDLDFVLRLMEQHGIYYYFKHTEDGHKLVLADSKSAHDLVQAPAAPSLGGNSKAGGAFPFMPRGPIDRRFAEHFTIWSAERRLQTGRVELTDYDYKKSTSDLSRSKEDGVDAAKRYEVFDYPGKYTERSDGQRFAEIRVQAKQALDSRRYAQGEAPSLFPGALCNVVGLSGEDGEYLVVRGAHRFSAQGYESGAASGLEDTYQGAYELLKSDKRFRAPIVTPRPVIHGPQTARVVGENRKQGEEIDVDEYGCIYVQFHWDRNSKDKTTSRRVRVAQVWSGKNWGGQIIPRIGQEVVVEFLEGDPDQPLVVGTVYNDQYKLPYELPANKTQSGLKTNSSKGGGGFNELKFEDRKGSEKVSFRAEKDHDILVRDGQKTEIGVAFTSGRGPASRDTALKQGDDKLAVETGNQEVTIAMNQTVDVGQTIEVTAGLKILLKVGASTIEMTPASITIKSPTIKVDGVMTEVKGSAMLTLQGGLVKIN